MSASLAGLWIYPLKSAAALPLSECAVEARGLQDDRRWMLVDADGRFITGRQIGALVRIQAQPQASGLRLRAPGQPELSVPVPSVLAPRRPSTVWSDTVAALDAGDAAAEWLSATLGQSCRLVYMDAAAQRPVDPKYAQPGDEVSFADGYPLLLISKAAIDLLSSRVGEAMHPLRFRPNLLIDAVPAHAEDQWRRIRIGAVEFEVVKPCVRCVFTTVDPDSGERHPGGEPLHSLKHYRRGPKGITFGQNLIARAPGTLRLGDPLEILATR